MTDSALTAAQAGGVGQTCALLSRPGGRHRPVTVHVAVRRSSSVAATPSRTPAPIIAATICYVSQYPAGTPTNTLTRPADTIMDGVAALPLRVLAVGTDCGCCERHDPAREADRACYLLITVQRRSIGGDRERTRLYRMVDHRALVHARRFRRRLRRYLVQPGR